MPATIPATTTLRLPLKRRLKSRATSTSNSRAIFARFGLTDDRIIHLFTLYANQYRNEQNQRASELTAWADNFRPQQVLADSLAQTQDSPVWEVRIDVKAWFLKRLKEFGIDFLTSPNGDVHVMKVDPLPMVDWSDMQKADVLLVRGGVIPGGLIRWGTNSRFSHAVLYTAEPGAEVFESLGVGPTTTSKKAFLESCGKIVKVMWHFMISEATATKVIEFAKKNHYRDGTEPKSYDGLGAVGGAGLKTMSGKVITAESFFVSPVLPPLIYGAYAADNTKNSIYGADSSLFCS